MQKQNLWNGSSWTELADLNTARLWNCHLATGAVYTSALGIAGGLVIPVLENCTGTEILEWICMDWKLQILNTA